MSHDFLDQSRLLPEVIRNDRRDNLQISEDLDRHGGTKPVAVLLFTPDMLKLMEHFHIELDMDMAVALHLWLGAFIIKHTRFRT